MTCGNNHVFDNDDAERYADDMGVRDPYPVYVWMLRCPFCHNTDLLEVDDADV